MPRYLFGNGDLCWTCGKPSNGEKQCPACYEKAVRSIAHARSCVKNGCRNEYFVFGRKEGSERCLIGEHTLLFNMPYCNACYLFITPKIINLRDLY